jgi:hypothetical protein
MIAFALCGSQANAGMPMMDDPLALSDNPLVLSVQGISNCEACTVLSPEHEKPKPDRPAKRNSGEAAPAQTPNILNSRIE